MTLAQFTERQLLVPRLLSTDQAGAITELVARLYRAGRIDDSLAFFQAVMQREYTASTLTQEGVAFPHARGKGARSLSIAVGLSPQGIAWDKNQTAHTIFLLAVPVSQLEAYLKLIGALARVVRCETEFSQLRQCAQPEEMLRVLEAVPLATTVAAVAER